MPADAAPADASITVLAATWLETWITRLALRGVAPVRQVGVGAGALSGDVAGRIIVCGLAGALARSITPGTAVIPDWVGTPSGRRHPCDPALVAALTDAARRSGLDVASGPLLTSPTLVTGKGRSIWADQGFVAVDMESAVLFARGMRGAVVRVILDTPDHELSTIWEHPCIALRQPGVWIEALGLAINAPRASFRAARVVRGALQP